MLRRIHTELPLPVTDGVLIERASLREGALSARLACEARKHARHIVEAADNEAEAVRRYACAAGFTTGFEEALQALGAWLAQYDAICTQAVLELRAETKERLCGALLDPVVVDHVIDAVFGSTSAWHARCIRVRLPRQVAHLAPRLAKAVESVGGDAIEIQLSHDDRLTIECGDQVFVFDASELAHSMTEANPPGGVRTPVGARSAPPLRDDIDFATLRERARTRGKAV